MIDNSMWIQAELDNRAARTRRGTPVRPRRRRRGLARWVRESHPTSTVD